MSLFLNKLVKRFIIGLSCFFCIFSSISCNNKNKDEVKVINLSSPRGDKTKLSTLNQSFKDINNKEVVASIYGLTNELKLDILNVLSNHYSLSRIEPLKLIHDDFVDIEKWNIFPNEDTSIEQSELLEDYSLCWAAATCNALWLSGWVNDICNPLTNNPFTSEDEFFNWFTTDIINYGSKCEYGLDYFFNGTFMKNESGKSVWMGSDSFRGFYSNLASELLYEKIDLVDTDYSLKEILSTSNNDSFEASIGSLIDGEVDVSTHSISISGCLCNSEGEINSIIIVDSDNDGRPSESVDGSTDNKRKLDRAKRPNSYTIYPIRKIKDKNNKSCYEINGYSNDSSNTYIIYQLIKLKGYSNDNLNAAKEIKGSKDIHSDSDFVIANPITSSESNSSYFIDEKNTKKFNNLENIYLIFYIYNRIVYSSDEYKEEKIKIRLKISKNNFKDFIEKIYILDVGLMGPDFFKQSILLDKDMYNDIGKYKILIEVNPSLDGSDRLFESYYLNNITKDINFDIVEN